MQNVRGQTQMVGVAPVQQIGLGQRTLLQRHQTGQFILQSSVQNPQLVRQQNVQGQNAAQVQQQQQQQQQQGPQQMTNQMMEAQKRLLAQQQQQQLVSGSSSENNYYSDNINELLNTSVAPNATVKLVSNKNGEVILQSSNVMPQRFQVSGNQPGGQPQQQQQPQTPQQSQGQTVMMSPSPVPPNTSQSQQISPAQTSGQQRHVGSGPNQYSSLQQSSNSRMSPFGQPSTPSGTPGVVGSSALSPAPPVSPMLVNQQMQAQQSQMNWNQQPSPAPRTLSSAPSPQMMSPSSTSQGIPTPGATPTPPPSVVPGSGMTPNLVTIQQQQNPMLNAQLSGKLKFPLKIFLF